MFGIKLKSLDGDRMGFRW